MSSRFAFALVLVMASTWPIGATEPNPKADAELVATAKGMLKNLQRHTLDNGLRVYLLPVKSSPIVTTMVAYRVGSGDEEKDQTGLSHYLEHLMFKGTDKLKPGDIDRATQRNGGHNNAYTTEDMTVYHFDFGADRWSIALEIEADRMRNLRIDAKHEFQQEKGAVISELAGGEDSPGDLEYKAILPMLFPKDSPYSHPVIGERKHVRDATAEIIKRHYDKWYHPNNASLVIVGGFDPDDALALVKKLFGPIPRADLPPRKKATQYQHRQGPVHKEFESKFDVARMLMGFNGVTVGSPEDPILDITQHILSDGRTSRLYRKLVEEERIASSVDAGNDSGRYPGWFAVSLDLLKGKDRKRAEELVFGEFNRLATELVSDEELNRARRKILASVVFGRESVHGQANAIARTSAYPGGEDVAKFYQDYLDRILSVSKTDIQRAAKEYLARSKACVVWSVPKESAKRGAGNPEPSSPSHRQRTRNAEEGAGGSTFSLTAAKRIVLPNGLTVILLEDHRLPVVVAMAEAREVILREPADQAGVAALTGSLLDEGTDKHTGKQIAALIEDTGGVLNLGMSGGSFKVLTPDTDLGLNMLFECLMHPTFPADAFARLKDQQLSAIDDEQTQPDTRAANEFNALVYGRHPFARPTQGTRATVEKLTAADCRAFHATAFAPNLLTVVVVGDFRTGEMARKIETLTRDWKKSEVAPPKVPAPPRPTPPTEKIISDPQAAQVHVYIGELGIKRANPDYYRLLVMDNVLGSGPGFTYRLSATLRDRQGLAYTVTASIASSAGLQSGTFSGYVGTFPDKFLDVKHGFLREIVKLRDEAPSETEVEDAKKYLLGSLPFRFTTLSAIASQLLSAERYGLGFDFLEKYKKDIAAVTPADVQAMAKKYLDPKSLVIVAVGPIDKDGKPLKEKQKDKK